MQMEEMRLDGNAAGGMLGEVFSHEMTAAMATCSGCKTASPVGRLMNYGGEMGTVLRCPVCDTVMVRIVRTDRWIRFEASGTAMFVIQGRAGR